MGNGYSAVSIGKSFVVFKHAVAVGNGFRFTGGNIYSLLASSVIKGRFGLPV